MNRWLRFVKIQMEMQFRLTSLSFVGFVVMIIQPIVFSTVALFLGGGFSKEPLQVVASVIGGGLYGLWGNVLYSSAFDITRDRWDSMLEQILGSPVDLSRIVRIRVLTNVLVGIISLAFALLIAGLFLDLRLSGSQALWLLISVVVTLIGFWSMGVILANLNALSRGSKLLITFIEGPILFLAGLMFPIEILPGWMQWISAILPVRWSVSAIRDSLSGQAIAPGRMGFYLGAALLISAIYTLFSTKLSVLVHDKIRISGEARYV